MTESVRAMHRDLSSERQRAISILADAFWWLALAECEGAARAPRMVGRRYGEWRAAMDTIERLEGDIAWLTAWHAERWERSA